MLFFRKKLVEHWEQVMADPASSMEAQRMHSVTKVEQSEHYLPLFLLKYWAEQVVQVLLEASQVIQAGTSTRQVTQALFNR